MSNTKAAGNLDELAQDAYNAYAGYLGIFGAPGAKHWEDLPPQRQQAWRKAAEAIQSHTRVPGADDSESEGEG